MEILEEILRQEDPRFWVFGYGSLTWKPDIDYKRKMFGYIRGYMRRFWQGSQTHRGTEHQLGRVATLIPEENEHVWGVAYEVCGKEAVKKALGGLTTREITLGGYEVQITSFHCRDDTSTSFPVVLYMATDNNPLFLGGTDIDSMAQEIVSAKGFAGPNTEYVTKLADYVREFIPEDNDKHLFELDRRIRELLDLNKRLGDTDMVANEYDSEGNSNVDSDSGDNSDDCPMKTDDSTKSLESDLTFSKKHLAVNDVDLLSFASDKLRSN